MDHAQKRLYSLLLVLIVLQLFTIGLLVTRTGGVPEMSPESAAVTETVSQVESLMKPTLGDVGSESVADSALASRSDEADELASVDFSLPTRVQILNGCGARGFGKKIAPVFRRRGFDVREIGNADNFRYENTLVLDRKGELVRALALADSFGISHEYVKEELDAKLIDIDVTLIAGRDYKSLNFQLSE